MTWLFALLEGFTCWLAVEDPCGEGTLRHESLILANGEERSSGSKAGCLDDEDDDWRDEGRQSDVVGCLRRDRGPDGCQHVTERERPSCSGRVAVMAVLALALANLTV